MKRSVPVEFASAFMDEKMKELGDWRGKTLAKVREIVHQADPEVVVCSDLFGGSCRLRRSRRERADCGKEEFHSKQLGRQGNFELLIPQDRLLNHYVRDNDNSQMSWHLNLRLAYPTPGPKQLGRVPRSVSFIQSNYKGDGAHGNFEAIVRVSPPLATEGVPAS